MDILPELNQLFHFDNFTLGELFEALTILVLGYFCAHWGRMAVRSIARVSHMDPTLSLFLALLVKYTIFTVVLIATLGKLGVQTTSLVAVLASAGLGIGLALKSTLSDLASGIIILLFRPFSVGDFVKIGLQYGQIHELGLFLTKLVDRNHVLISIPNGLITKGNIENHTIMGTVHRHLDITIAPGDYSEELENLCIETVAKASPEIKAPKPIIAMSALSGKSITLTITFYCSFKGGEEELILALVRRSLFFTFQEKNISLL